jgi:hypothetical protein
MPAAFILPSHVTRSESDLVRREVGRRPRERTSPPSARCAWGRILRRAYAATLNSDPLAMPSTGAAKARQNAKNNRKHNAIRDAKRAVLRATRLLTAYAQRRAQQLQALSQAGSDAASSDSSSAQSADAQAILPARPLPLPAGMAFPLAQPEAGASAASAAAPMIADPAPASGSGAEAGSPLEPLDEVEEALLRLEDALREDDGPLDAALQGSASAWQGMQAVISIGGSSSAFHSVAGQADEEPSTPRAVISIEGVDEHVPSDEEGGAGTPARPAPGWALRSYHPAAADGGDEDQSSDGTQQSCASDASSCDGGDGAGDCGDAHNKACRTLATSNTAASDRENVSSLLRLLLDGGARVEGLHPAVLELLVRRCTQTRRVVDRVVAFPTPPSLLLHFPAGTMRASRLSIPSLTFACCACRCRSGAAYGYVRTRTRTCRRARPPGECHAAARYAVRSTTFIESSDGASASLEAIRAKLRRWCKRTFVGARPWTAPRTDTPLASYGQR